MQSKIVDEAKVPFSRCRLWRIMDLRHTSDVFEQRGFQTRHLRARTHEMTSSDHHLNQRLSLKNQTCTVRYVGPVVDKAGEWLGVEWDDPTRGKHNGEHAGTKYFECLSSSGTAASFLRPNQQWDESRTFLQALRAKYVERGSNSNSEIVYISGKQAEEIGFDKFAKRQAALRGIHVLVLDRMRIRHPLTPKDAVDDREKISEVCAGITDLDIRYNLFESFEEIIDLCARLPKLRSLTLDGNRFTVSGDYSARLTGIRNLSVSNTLLGRFEVSSLVSHHISGVGTLVATNNEWRDTDSITGTILPDVHTLDLSDNCFTSLSGTRGFLGGDVRSIILKNNMITEVIEEAAMPVQSSAFSKLEELDLSRNSITSLNFFDDLSKHFPALRHLRVTGNPLYNEMKSADNKPLTSDDGYMLTIARLPHIDTLNYSKVTDKERLNAEAYYLKQIAIELSLAPKTCEQSILQNHPRWNYLCEEYGPPDIARKTDQNAEDPNIIAARLLTVEFQYAVDDKVLNWTEELPKSLNIYTVLGVVGKRLGAMPLSLNLTLETDERDPIGQHKDGYSGPQWCESDAESDEELGAKEGGDSGDAEWIQRTVKLIPGTRTLGTYIEGREARIRVGRQTKDDLY
ncbi:Hypothetical protein R9X50_00253100 [Acrodontium crateriforme]|uniref:CAP-Gly domain-containing protein n=1 Tax=Acrodontium crateriforme TaxID=150365 RepID=A0AAQ3RB29_9PEZI|nr:Hypothetical protein R9X50_00253100 [Acrodontium crateriforme]